MSEPNNSKSTNDGDLYLGGALISGIIVFIAVWVYAISQWGFLLGIMFGWLPALIAGFIGGAIWPILLLLLLVFIWMVFK